jgi:hypothetical protein
MWRRVSITTLYAIHRLLERSSAGRARLVPYLFVAQPVAASSKGQLRAEPAFKVSIASSSNPVLEHFPRPKEVIANRYRAGARCYVATVADEFAGFIWICPQAYDEDEVRCRYIMPSATAWDFDVYVVPKYRLGRTLARLWESVREELRGDGIAWTFSRISLFNEASLRAHRRLGAETVGMAIFLVFGALQIVLGFRPFRLHAGLRSQPVMWMCAPDTSASSRKAQP